ncbi:MAG: ATP-binding cassette domain-containing protein, partial [Lachnospiraceae bacterium]|nr:ATP-binding cassette domain-containing protein [Lachnospiraceae bacterium]
MEKDIILSVKNLNVKFHLRGQELHAIRNVSLDIYRGESIAIVGESGSGKSVFTRTFMGLLDSNGYIPDGEILYFGSGNGNAPSLQSAAAGSDHSQTPRQGKDLTPLKKDNEWRTNRGGEIAMIMQG